jgi:hypothetical protein
VIALWALKSVEFRVFEGSIYDCSSPYGQESNY